MDKTVVLELKGNLQQQGFYVTLHIAQVNSAVDITLDGYLPPSSQLLNCLTQWQVDYRRLSMPMRSLKPYKLKLDGKIHPLDVCIESAQQLAQQFKQWLRSDSFRDIDLHLRQALMPTETVQVLIRSSSAEIQALPWHLWDFVEHYPKTEIALSSVRTYPRLSENKTTSHDQQVNILAILGDRQGLDIDSDCHSLNQLPGAYIDFLVEPTHHQLHDKLYAQAWDILFFAGHSETRPTGQGILRLNSTTCLSIDEARYAVQKAISKGLQLAIFNSCDGLGLAHALAELQLPHMIVMREAVPDPVAQQFLKHFLSALAQGQTLHLAARDARERLQSVEKDYPCASWLPIIYQQPTAQSLSWNQLRKPEGHQNQPVHCMTQAAPQLPSAVLPPTVLTPQRKRVSVQQLGAVLGLSLMVSGMMIGVRSQGWLQNWELKAYDQMMRMRPGQNVPDDRILIVAIGEDDIQYQRNQGMEMEGSLSDEALSALLQKIALYQPSVIGLDTFHDFPFDANVQSVLSNQIADQSLITICQVRSSANNLSDIAPPPTIPVEQQGFNNVPLDPDGVIRRQFLGMPSSEICTTEESFNFRISQTYLQKNNDISVSWVPELPKQGSQIKLGSQLFPRLPRHAGSYELSSADAGGYQLLVNYRSAQPETIQLSQILGGSLDSQLASLIRDRIILIGVVNPHIDVHLTPYSNKSQAEPVSGVIVQAHMISQVISAALGERPLISWWTGWVEMIWIGSWICGGSLLVLVWRSPYLRVINLVLILSVLWVTCLFLLVKSWWVPFVPQALGLGIVSVSSTAIFCIAKKQ